MVVTEQIEALSRSALAGADAGGARLIALIVMLPLLTVIADIVSIMGGAYIANVTAHVSLESFSLGAALLRSSICSRDC